MGYPSKIATCCYCGTRAALVLRGQDRHELSCAACGAPLHDLKTMPVERGGAKRDAVQANTAGKSKKKNKKAKKSKRKNPMRSMLGEAFDLIEDIFD